MIIKKELVHEYDKKGTVHLYTTYDTSLAAEIAKEISESGGGRSKRGEMRCLGYIPPEEWRFNPWLIEATKARDAGDKGEYLRLVKKYFELFPQYKVITPQKYY